MVDCSSISSAIAIISTVTSTSGVVVVVRCVEQPRDKHSVCDVL